MKKRFIELMLSLTVMLSALMPGTSVFAEMAAIFFFLYLQYAFRLK